MIQDGIDAAITGDTVLDGNFTYDCVTFNNGEGPASVLKRFKIINTGND